VRQVHKNLLNKNSLPYTAAELYALPVRKSVLKEYDLPHTMSLIHNDVKKLNGRPIWGTLIFSSTGAYGEIFLIDCNSAKE